MSKYTIEQPHTDLKQLTWVSDKLGEISNRISNTELNKLLRMRGQVMIDEAQNILQSGGHVLSGNLVDSIGFIERKGGRRLSRVIIGPRYYGGYKGQLAHIIEYGSAGAERFRFLGNKKMRLTNKSVKAKLLAKASTGVLPAMPFMRPAFERHKQQVMDALVKDITSLIMDEAKKLGFDTKAA